MVCLPRSGCRRSSHADHLSSDHPCGVSTRSSTVGVLTMSGFPDNRGLTDELVDALVRQRGVPGRPVAVVLGPRGSGKTTVLDEVDRRARGHVPTARLDFERGAWEQPSAVLTELAFGLSRKTPQFGRIPFPRLWLCALVVTSGLDAHSRPRAIAALNDTLRQDQPGERWREPTTRVAESLSGTVLPAWGASAADVLLSGLNWYTRRRLLTVVRGLPGAGSDPRDVLVDLARADTGSDRDRQAVDQVFFGAFLADLTAAYRSGIRHLGRTADCVVTLDNAHTPEGTRFLTALVAAQTEPAPLVVVATSRKWAGPWSKQWRREGSPGAKPAPRTPATAGADLISAGSYYLVRLEPGDSAQLPAGRVSGGLPWGRAAVDAVLQRVDGAPTRGWLRALLDQPTEPDGAVALADAALEYLLRDLSSPGLVRDLVTASAGRGLEFVGNAAVLGSDQPDGGDALRRELTGNLLTVPGPDGLPVLLPMVRRVLLWKLAARDADDPDSWEAVHGRCRAHHERAGARPEAAYHALAVGDLTPAVGQLAPPFETESFRWDVDYATRWLAKLDLITSAPNRLPPDGDPRDQVEELISGVPRSDNYGHTLPRLIASLWVAGDPLGDPLEELRSRIRASYTQLAARRGSGSNLLYERGED
jgi:hypothetical protein